MEAAGHFDRRVLRSLRLLPASCKLFTVGYCYSNELFSLEKHAGQRYDSLNVGYRG
jgi:hypothetical protein